MVGWHHRLDGHESEQAPGGVMNREDYHAVVLGVAKSGTRLSGQTELRRGHWHYIQHPNICILWVAEREDRAKGPEKILEEVIAENVPNLGKETVTEVQEVESYTE